eukprot:6965020-Lingulodinium_polyedra.AAC.1
MGSSMGTLSAKSLRRRRFGQRGPRRAVPTSDPPLSVGEGLSGAPRYAVRRAAARPCRERRVRET